MIDVISSIFKVEFNVEYKTKEPKTGGRQFFENWKNTPTLHIYCQHLELKCQRSLCDEQFILLGFVLLCLYIYTLYNTEQKGRMTVVKFKWMLINSSPNRRHHVWCHLEKLSLVKHIYLRLLKCNTVALRPKRLISKVRKVKCEILVQIL